VRRINVGLTVLIVVWVGLYVAWMVAWRLGVEDSLTTIMGGLVGLADLIAIVTLVVPWLRRGLRAAS